MLPEDTDEDHFSYQSLAIMKTTIKVGLPASDDSGASSLMRVVLPKKRTASPLSTKVSIKAKLSEDSDSLAGPSPSSEAQNSVKPQDPQLHVEDGPKLEEPKPRKRRETSQDEEARKQIISKILNESSKKLKKKNGDGNFDPRKDGRLFNRYKPDPPCVKLVSKRDLHYLSVPSAIDLGKLLNSTLPKERKETQECQCGRKGKYREPKSLRPFCSVACYRHINDR